MPSGQPSGPRHARRLTKTHRPTHALGRRALGRHTAQHTARTCAHLLLLLLGQRVALLDKQLQLWGQGLQELRGQGGGQQWHVVRAVARLGRRVAQLGGEGLGAAATASAAFACGGMHGRGEGYVERVLQGGGLGPACTSALYWPCSH